MNKRLFIAIELPDSLIDELSLSIDRLKSVSGLKTVDKHQLHLTLAFLGNIDTASIPKLFTIITESISNIQPLNIIVGTPEIFLGVDDFRGVWIAVQATAALTILVSKLRQQLLASGFTIDNKPFRPHITLARSGYQPDARAVQSILKQWGDGPFPPASASTVSLISSQLTPQGSIYTTEFSAKLD
ncbi:MAG: RNA 2',3'-cyclic phosphodiesterase [bacterium]